MLFCDSCGAEAKTGSSFCTECGARTSPTTPSTAVGRTEATTPSQLKSSLSKPSATAPTSPASIVGTLRTPAGSSVLAPLPADPASTFKTTVSKSRSLGLKSLATPGLPKSSERAIRASFRSTAPTAAAPAAFERAVPSGAPRTADSLRLEISVGEWSTEVEVGPEGATIGSARSSTIVVPATFLEPVHASFQWTGHFWWLMATSPSGVITINGRRVVDGVVAPGETIRLANAAGAFVTIRAKAPAPEGLRMRELRCALPMPGTTLTIGTAAAADVILDHPMIRPLHAIIHADMAGKVWVEDQATVAGTYINGTRIKTRQWLYPGDVIQVGPFSARVGMPMLEPLPKVTGVDIAVRGVTLNVGKANKRLLNQVSVRFAPGTITAIAGPSGAGKSTLMRLAAGQTSPTSGMVTYGNENLESCLNRYTPMVGFVPQDDIVHGDLTVREALRYQASLRLDGDRPAHDREAAVNHSIDFVELGPQADQLIKTLSGGQRKRVSVASELINDPQLLFLDEPTSGLDPGLDKRMMLLLRLLADGGRTVILTTHAIAHVDVCDQLILVGPGGNVIYAGPPREACAWFGVDSISDIYSLIETNHAAEEAAARRPRLAFEPVLDRCGSDRGGKLRRQNPFKQMALFTRRSVRLMSRDVMALTFALLQGIVVALLAAVVKPTGWANGGWATSGITYCTLFACSGVWIGVTASVREIVKERSIWRRESLIGARVSSYLASKLLILFSLAIIQSLSTVLVVAGTLGLPKADSIHFGPIFLDFVISIFIATIGGTGLGLVVSVFAPSSDRAMSMVPYLLIPQFFLSGTFFALGPMTFLSFLIPARWGSSSLGSIAIHRCVEGAQRRACPPPPIFDKIMVSTGGGVGITWLAGFAIVAVAVGITAAALSRQTKSWSVG